MYRYLTPAFAFVLAILFMLTFAFAMQLPASSNVALSANGAIAMASSVHVSGNYPVAAVNNGDRRAMNWGSGGGWNDNTQGDYSSDIVQINFPTFT